MNVTTNRMFLIWADSARAQTRLALGVIKTPEDISAEGHTVIINCLHGAEEAMSALRNMMDGCDCPDHSVNQDGLLASVIRARCGIISALDLIASDLHFCAEPDLLTASAAMDQVSEVLNLRIEMPELADS